MQGDKTQIILRHLDDLQRLVSALNYCKTSLNCVKVSCSALYCEGVCEFGVALYIVRGL